MEFSFPPPTPDPSRRPSDPMPGIRFDYRDTPEPAPWWVWVAVVSFLVAALFAAPWLQVWTARFGESYGRYYEWVVAR